MLENFSVPRFVAAYSLVMNDPENGHAEGLMTLADQIVLAPFIHSAFSLGEAETVTRPTLESLLQMYPDLRRRESRQTDLRLFREVLEDGAYRFLYMHALKNPGEAAAEGVLESIRSFLNVGDNAALHPSASESPEEHFTQLLQKKYEHIIPGFSLNSMVCGEGGFANIHPTSIASVEGAEGTKKESGYVAKVGKLRTKYPELAQDCHDREVELMSELDHPRILKVIAAGNTSEDRPYLVTQEVVGCNLHQHMEAGGGYDFKRPEEKREATDIILQIMDALSHAHARGIAHRDIKPENILMNAAKEISLIDFGIGCKATSDDRLLKKHQVVLGSIHYMPPEILWKYIYKFSERPKWYEEWVRANEDAQEPLRWDMYAVGITLFSILVGRHPFEEISDPKEILDAVRDRPDDLIYMVKRALNGKNIPLILQNIILKAMAVVPGHRYKYAGEMHDDLMMMEGEELYEQARVNIGQNKDALYRQAIAAHLSHWKKTKSFRIRNRILDMLALIETEGEDFPMRDILKEIDASQTSPLSQRLFLPTIYALPLGNEPTIMPPPPLSGLRTKPEVTAVLDVGIVSDLEQWYLSSNESAASHVLVISGDPQKDLALASQSFFDSLERDAWVVRPNLETWKGISPPKQLTTDFFRKLIALDGDRGSIGKILRSQIQKNFTDFTDDEKKVAYEVMAEFIGVPVAEPLSAHASDLRKATKSEERKIFLLKLWSHYLEVVLNRSEKSLFIFVEDIHAADTRSIDFLMQLIRSLRQKKIFLVATIDQNFTNKIFSGKEYSSLEPDAEDIPLKPVTAVKDSYPPGVNADWHYERAEELLKRPAPDRTQAAHHYHLADSPEKAAEQYLAAANEAHTFSRYDLAVSCFHEVVAHTRLPRVAYDAWRGLEEVYLAAKMTNDHEKVYGEVAKLFEDSPEDFTPTDRYGALMRRARYLYQTHRPLEAIKIANDLIEKFKKIAVRSDDLIKVWVSTLLIAGGCYRILSKRAQEASCYEDALVLCRQIEAPLQMAEILISKAYIHSVREELAEALKCNQDAVALYEGIGDGSRFKFSGYSGVAANLHTAGKLDEAKKYIEQALEEARHFGLEENALATLPVTRGQVLIHQGAYQEAIDYLRRFRELFPTSRYTPYLMLFLAQAYFLNNDLGNAAEIIRQFQERYKEQYKGVRAGILAIKSIIDIRNGNRDLAVLSSYRSIKLLNELEGSIEDIDMMVRQLRIECLMACGRSKEADTARAQAKRVILERTQTLPPDWQEAFLKMPPHPEIISAA